MIINVHIGADNSPWRAPCPAWGSGRAPEKVKELPQGHIAKKGSSLEEEFRKRFNKIEV